MNQILPESIISLLKSPSNYLLNQIPCFYPSNDYYLLYWQTKKEELLSSYTLRIESLDKQLKNETSPLTQTKLSKLQKAYAYNLKKTEELLSPLSVKNKTTTSSLKNIIPSQQTLSLYWDNIFRDWSWEGEENSLTAGLIKKVLPSHWAPEYFLVLGTGASRLAVDLHESLAVKNTLAFDFNPFLLFITQAMIENNTLKFYEIPANPLFLEEVAIAKLLKNPYGKKIKNFFPLLGDIQDLPFKAKSIPVVLTPWVIDILPMDFAKLCERINDILPLGGEWINLGPLGFMQAKESQRLTFDEIKEVLAAKGFLLKQEILETLPYLDSPHGGQKRKEKVICYRAIKKADTPLSPFSYLPEWLLDKNKPIPLSPEIKQHQILAKTNADVFFTIDGKKSFNDIALLLSQHYKMPMEIALQTLTSLFTKFFESQNRALK